MSASGSKHIFSVVCGNGLGHFKRSVAILATLLEAHPDLKITLCAEEFQFMAFQNDKGLNQIKNAGADFVMGKILPGVTWTYDQIPTAQQFEAWKIRLSGVSQLKDADLVLSDNLVGVLSLRSDAILLGSFLWPEVFEATVYAQGSADHLRRWIAEEYALLEKYAPPMIAVEALAMPRVRALKNIHTVGWMCEHSAQLVHNFKVGDRIRVGALTGATPGGRALRESIAARISLDRDFEFVAARKEPVDVMIVRPGAGALTDCVGAQVPIVALVENDPSPEMIWNANQVQKLGLGIALPEATWNQQGAAAIAKLSQSPDLDAAFKRQPTDGLKSAAEWISKQL